MLLDFRSRALILLALSVVCWIVLGIIARRAYVDVQPWAREIIYLH